MIGNHVYSQGYQEFESLPLRQKIKGLLQNSDPFFFAVFIFISDLISDRFENVCHAPINSKLVKVYFGGANVHVPKHKLRPAGIIKVCGDIMAQTVRGEKRHLGFFTNIVKQFFYFATLAGVACAGEGIYKNMRLALLALLREAGKDFV